VPDPAPQPDPAADPHPWESWGTARRDCAPHRGNWLLLLARLALACAALSLFLTAATLLLLTRVDDAPSLGTARFLRAATVLLPLGDLGLALAGAVLGVLVWCLTARDLGRMWAGSMDPNGSEATRAARHRATSAVLVSSVLLLSGVGVLALALMH
jgi:hypothetical protein